VLLLDAEKDKRRIEEAKLPANRLPMAFVCSGKSRGEPLADEEEVSSALKSFK